MRTNAFRPHLGTTGSTGVGIAVGLAQAPDAPHGISDKSHISQIHPQVGEKDIQENAAGSQSQQIEKGYFHRRLMKQVIQQGYPQQQDKKHAEHEQSQYERQVEGIQRRVIIIPLPGFRYEMLHAVIQRGCRGHQPRQGNGKHTVDVVQPDKLNLLAPQGTVHEAEEEHSQHQKERQGMGVAEQVDATGDGVYGDEVAKRSSCYGRGYEAASYRGTMPTAY